MIFISDIDDESVFGMDFDFNNPDLLKKVIAHMCFEDGHYFCKYRVWRQCEMHYDPNSEYGKEHPNRWFEWDWECLFERDAWNCRKCELFDLDMAQVLKEYDFLKER